MVSNQKFDAALAEINEITNLEAYLFTMDGVLLASTSELPEGFVESRNAFVESEELQADIKEFHFHVINVEDEVEYVLGLWGEEYTSVLGRMAAAQVKIVGLSFAQQYDRNSFMQNVLLSNLLPIDMVTKAKKLHIDDCNRVVYVIDTARKNNDLVLETVKNLSNIKSKDFVFRLDESSVILVKALPNGCSEEEEEALLQETADQLVDNIHMEVMVKVRVGFGNPADSLKDIARSYQEAQMALEVGRVFYAEQDTISYGRLGIGRLIYQLPLSLCEMFIKEVFGEQVPDILEDEEAMNTIGKFFENSLNISETARQLYLHRNTLVYRLERIQKAVGLDIRNFEDAMTFRIAVMVLAHMKENK